METVRVLLLQKLREKVMQDHHDGQLAGYFSGPRLYKSLVKCWWWPRMCTDVITYADSCAQCAILEGNGSHGYSQL